MSKQPRNLNAMFGRFRRRMLAAELPTGPLSAETSTTRQSPRAGPCRPRPQTRRACQSGRLASTSPAGASTPCAVSSVAVEAPGWSTVRQRAGSTS